MSSKSVIRSQQQHKVFIASVSYTAIAPLYPLVPDRLMFAGMPLFASVQAYPYHI